ncbi:MFS transporter [Streptomyces sp. NPDC001902]
MSLGMYRHVLIRPVLTWGAVAVGARMPVAMAPLALVFLVRERPGGYTFGALLAAAYVIGEIVGAPLLGMRLAAERARPQLAVGLAAGTVGFAGLGVLPDAHPVVLAGFAFLAGAAPAAAPGGMRQLLTSIVPERAVTQALSAESVLTFGIWAVSPAAVTGLALGVAPYTPLLLAAVLMAASVAGLWALPAGWRADHRDRGGESMLRITTRAWPVYVTGAASLSLLALAELILPALLEHRGIALGLAGPLLAGFAAGSGVGSFLYGLRAGWPGRLPVQSLVLLLAVSACVALVAVLPSAPWMGAILLVAGVLQAGAMLTRNLQLRQVLPASALAAGYSVMYAAVGAGYAAAGSLSGALLRVVEPDVAILAGVGLTLLLTAVAAAGERSMRGRTAGVGPDLGTAADGAPVGGRDDARHSL